MYNWSFPFNSSAISDLPVFLHFQAEQHFAAEEYEAALKTLNEITGAGGALLRWSDQEKFAEVRRRQAACSLALARQLAQTGQQVNPIGPQMHFV